MGADHFIVRRVDDCWLIFTCCGLFCFFVNKPGLLLYYAVRQCIGTMMTLLFTFCRSRVSHRQIVYNLQ